MKQPVKPTQAINLFPQGVDGGNLAGDFLENAYVPILSTLYHYVNPAFRNDIRNYVVAMAILTFL